MKVTFETSELTRNPSFRDDLKELLENYGYNFLTWTSEKSLVVYDLGVIEPYDWEDKA